MKNILFLFIFLLSLFLLPCVLPQQVKAEAFEWAEKARNKPSPAKEAYDRAVAEQAAKREADKKAAADWAAKINAENKAASERASKLAPVSYDLSQVEGKIISRDLEGARQLSVGLERSLKDEAEDVIDYYEKYFAFANLAVVKSEATNAIAYYQYLVQAFGKLPDELHFSADFVKLINDTLKRADNFVDRECGKDYMNIRVGMQLPRVQKCVGEFFLRGQAKRKEGIVDYYTSGGAYLYVKNGRVVAWGN